MKKKETYSVTQVAKILNVSSQCVRNYIKKRYLKASKKNKTGIYQILGSDFKKFLKGKKEEPKKIKRKKIKKRSKKKTRFTQKLKRVFHIFG